MFSKDAAFLTAFITTNDPMSKSTSASKHSFFSLLQSEIVMFYQRISFHLNQNVRLSNFGPYSCLSCEWTESNRHKSNEASQIFQKKWSCKAYRERIRFVSSIRLFCDSNRFSITALPADSLINIFVVFEKIWMTPKKSVFNIILLVSTLLKGNQ